MTSGPQAPPEPRPAQAGDAGLLPPGTPPGLAAPLTRLGASRRGFGRELAGLRRQFTPRLLRVPPDRVTGAIDTKHWTGEDHRAAVLDGDWDLVRVERPIIARTIAQLAAGAHYTETDQFPHMVAIVERGTGEWNYHCETVEDVHAYFRRLVAAWEAIRAGDYRTQQELGGRKNDEIVIHVARDGELVVGQYGNHRLEMTRQAGLEAVPMLLRTVHLAWARRCYDRFGSPLESALQRGLVELGAG
ncbi:hypothetical protein [Egibacter rhizosphaerae]|uniref:hypothetical protein n=1 Tax=Egibacter rhizosphaerae TaxID=1670831 RepID=UPI0013F14FFF|nr:hypothetical protein [Egibacter rhizosphaerae]